MTSDHADRRRFLASSSVAVMACAGSVAEPVSAADRTKKVRVAVVGSGGRGSDLIRALSTIERACITAVCDDYPPHLEQGIRYAGGEAKAFSDYGKMLREASADAIVVATPLHLHFPMCLQAVEAGRAVFCEKTMCHSVDEAVELSGAVAKAGAVFQVGLQRRANAIYRQAAAMVETGMLGDITAIKCQWHRNNDWRRPVPVGRQDSRWRALEHRLNWRLYWDYSQGLMTELGSHQLDVANRLLGTTPRRVSASGGVDYWRDGREVFDNVFCVYEYDLPRAAPDDEPDSSKGRTVRVAYSSLQNNAFEGASELVMGTEGTLFLTQKKGLFYQEHQRDDPGWSRDGRVSRDASIITSGKTLKMSADPWAHRGKPYEINATGDDTRDELVAFLACVADENPQTICDARVGLENAVTVILANKAVREACSVEFPRVA